MAERSFTEGAEKLRLGDGEPACRIAQAAGALLRRLADPAQPLRDLCRAALADDSLRRVSGAATA